jgi:hypothetical protein
VMPELCMLRRCLVRNKRRNSCRDCNGRQADMAQNPGGFAVTLAAMSFTLGQ